VKRESELYPAVKAWLEAQGYTVHVEIFDCDVIGIKDGRAVVIELKKFLSHDLIRQLYTRVWWCDEVWAVIPTQPREIPSTFASEGWGLLQLRDGKLRVRRKAKPQPWSWHKRKAYRMKKLMNRKPAMPHEVAGLPSCPTLSQQRENRGG
jgi:hypothetical protein